MSSDPQIHARLNELSRRLAEVERRLNIEPAPAPTPRENSPPPQSGTVSSALAPVVDDSRAASSPLPAAPSITPPIRPPTTPAARRAAALSARSTPTPVSSVQHAKPVASAFNFEKLVGGRIYAVAGALIVVVGLGLFLKLGIDRGWFTLSPLLRCTAAAGFGCALIVAGELVRRRLQSAAAYAAAGITGAGLAIIFGSVFAAFNLYSLMSAPVAFTLMALVSALGVGIGLYSSSLAVAVLALVGAYINPLLIGESNASPLILPGYLLALLGLGLVLATWRPAPFRALRLVVWLGTAIVGLLWTINIGNRHAPVAVGFYALVWLAIHAELYFSSRRLVERPARASWRIAPPVLSSFAATLWSVGLGVLVVQFARASLIQEWWVTAGFFVASAVLGVMLAGNLRALADEPTNDAQRLGVGLWAQAGALLIATVALALSGGIQVVSWLAMGCAAIFAGRWARIRVLDGYGFIVLTIAAVRLVTYDSWNLGPTSDATNLLGVAPSTWLVLMLAGGVAWLAGAVLLRRSVESIGRRLAVNAAILIGCSLLLGGALHPTSANHAIVLALVLLALVLVFAARWRRSLMLGLSCVFAQAAAALAWGIAYALPALDIRGDSLGVKREALGESILTHPAFLFGLVACAGALGGSIVLWAMRRPDRRLYPLGVIAWVVLGALFLSCTTLETARAASLLTSDTLAQGAAVSVYWALLAVAFIVIGFSRGWPPVRHIGLGLLGVAAAKAVLLDLAGVGPEWRIVSLVGVGLLMLGVSLGYAKASATLAKQASAPPPPPAPPASSAG